MRKIPLSAPFLAAAAVLVPWTIHLGQMLPSRHLSAHWDIVWVGFDLALAVALGLIGLAAARRSAWLEGAATASASLLLVDAWFDVLTSRTMAERLVALVEAGLAEIPLALVCIWVARRAVKQRSEVRAQQSFAKPSARPRRARPSHRSTPEPAHIHLRVVSRDRKSAMAVSWSAVYRP